MAALAVDADGQVAQTRQDSRQATGADLGVVLAEGAVTHAVELICDQLVAADPASDSVPVAEPLLLQPQPGEFQMHALVKTYCAVIAGTGTRNRYTNASFALGPHVAVGSLTPRTL